MTLPILIKFLPAINYSFTDSFKKLMLPDLAYKLFLSSPIKKMFYVILCYI